MDIVINDKFEKLRKIINTLKFWSLEDILSDCLEAVPNESCINYVGELNKNDVLS